MSNKLVNADVTSGPDRQNFWNRNLEIKNVNTCFTYTIDYSRYMFSRIQPRINIKMQSL